MDDGIKFVINLKDLCIIECDAHVLPGEPNGSRKNSSKFEIDIHMFHKQSTITFQFAQSHCLSDSELIVHMVYHEKSNETIGS